MTTMKLLRPRSNPLRRVCAVDQNLTNFLLIDFNFVEINVVLSMWKW